MKFFLIVAKGKKAGLPIPIEIDLFLIGSAEECQLRAVHDDIGEQHDLAGEMPDKVEELRKRLHAWRDEVGAPP